MSRETTTTAALRQDPAVLATELAHWLALHLRASTADDRECADAEAALARFADAHAAWRALGQGQRRLLRKPEEWLALCPGAEVVHPEGWDVAPAVLWDEAIFWEDFVRRYRASETAGESLPAHEPKPDLRAILQHVTHQIDRAVRLVERAYRRWSVARADEMPQLLADVASVLHDLVAALQNEGFWVDLGGPR